MRDEGSGVGGRTVSQRRRDQRGESEPGQHPRTSVWGAGRQVPRPRGGTPPGARCHRAEAGASGRGPRRPELRGVLTGILPGLRCR